jgi:hypothetical protein
VFRRRCTGKAIGLFLYARGMGTEEARLRLDALAVQWQRQKMRLEKEQLSKLVN